MCEVSTQEYYLLTMARFVKCHDLSKDGIYENEIYLNIDHISHYMVSEIESVNITTVDGAEFIIAKKEAESLNLVFD